MKHPKRQRAPHAFSWPRLVLLAAEIAMNALLCLYLSEIVSRAGRSSALAWTVNQPGMFLATLAVFFGVDLFLVCLINRPAPALALGNLLLLLPAVINYYKRLFRGEYFLLSDLLVADVALDVLPGYQWSLPPALLFALVMLLAVLPAAIGFGRVFPAGRPHFFAAVLSLIACAAAVTAGFSAPLPNQFYLTEQLYNNAGTMRAAYETRPKQLQRPAGYSHKEAAALLGGYGQAVAEDAVRPDIFFIMSESLFDLVGTCQIEASADPLARFHLWQQETAGTNALCHSYGGGTFEAEYEVLTGYRAIDTPGTLSADTRAIPAGMRTLVTMLDEMGYQTLAMHPNRGGAYQRRRNYASMGFERALFREDLADFTQFVGKYPADSELFDQIIAAYDARDRSRPWFCHVVTFQNHGGYAYDYNRRDIRVSNRDGVHQLSAENYLNGVLAHVEAVQALLSHLAAQERPAVVLIWGDHAPNMANFAVSVGSGAASAPFYKTPVLIWNNYGADLSPGEESMGMYRLGAFVLAKLGLCPDPYFDWLAGSPEADMLTSLRLMAPDGQVKRDDAAYDALDLTLLKLHYDRLIGETEAAR